MIEPSERAVPFGTGVTARVVNLEDAQQRTLWDSLVPDNHLSFRSDFVLLNETISTPRKKVIPVLYGIGGAAKAIAVFAEYSLDLAMMAPQSIRKAIGIVRRMNDGAFRLQALEMGNPLAPTKPLLSHVAEITPLRAIDIARRDGCVPDTPLTIIRDLQTEWMASGLDELSRENYCIAHSEDLFVLPLPFTSFDEYRASLRSEYRYRIKKVFSRSENLTVSMLSDFSSEATQMEKLWILVHDRASNRLGSKLNAAFFELLSRAPWSAAAVVRDQDDLIVGFGTMFKDGSTYRFSSVGFSKQSAIEDGVYFRLIYEAIRQAIAEGCDRIILGVTTPQPKLSVGAIPVPLSVAIRHRNIVANIIIRRLIPNLLSSPKSQSFNVFRGKQPSTSEPALSDYDSAKEE